MLRKQNMNKRAPKASASSIILFYFSCFCYYSQPVYFPDTIFSLTLTIRLFIVGAISDYIIEQPQQLYLYKRRN